MSESLTRPRLYTYESYLEMFAKWVQTGSSSSANPGPELVEFTKLNWARTQRLHKTISLDPAIKTAVEKIEHSYHWMVITEAWCGDSAQNLPIIAEIAKLLPEKIKLSILLRDENPEMMDKYLTNGARAIPKLIATNQTLNKDAFAWGPRPAPAQQLLLNWKNNPGNKTWDDFEKELHGWYAKDKSNTLQSEFLEIIRQLH